ncbi:hypothetical protein [Actinophytocola sediminis]
MRRPLALLEPEVRPVTAAWAAWIGIALTVALLARYADRWADRRNQNADVQRGRTRPDTNELDEWWW